LRGKGKWDYSNDYHVDMCQPMPFISQPRTSVGNVEKPVIFIFSFAVGLFV